MLTVSQIAAGVRASREEFATLFLRVQVDLARPGPQRRLFDGVATAAAVVGAFEQALRHADDEGWLHELVAALVAAQLADASLARALVDAADKPAGSTLEAMTRLAAGFTEPDVALKGLAGGMRWTVRIAVDGTFSGTGILVGPHLVLTAWHVVRKLFARQADDTLAPIVGAGKRLRVEFDDFRQLIGNGALAAREPLRTTGHERQWCVAFSACHVDELNETLPGNLTELEGCWDYAVIRLASLPGSERNWLRLDPRGVVPRASSDIVVLQHPAGQPLVFDRADIVDPVATAATAVPRLRFLHRANATNGSSGGPCFDKTFVLFGLHQGSWPGPGNNGVKLNRGVPLLRVIEDFQRKLGGDLPLPDPTDVLAWRVTMPDGREAPVIGCDDFQAGSPAFNGSLQIGRSPACSKMHSRYWTGSAVRRAGGVDRLFEDPVMPERSPS